MSLDRMAAAALAEVNWLVLAYFAVANGFYGVLLFAAGFEMRRVLLERRGEASWRLLDADIAPSISVLAPAHDEAATISDSVQAMLSLYYPALQVVVVNDGSTDATMALLKEGFALVEVPPTWDPTLSTAAVRHLYHSRLHPNLLVVDKDQGGKADALNAGLNVATGALVCAIDADTLVEPDALHRMVQPFLATDRLVAAGGTLRIVNGCRVAGGRVVQARVARHALGGFQAVEYLRAFLFGRLGWNRLGGNMIVSGAFGLFDRAALLDVGGYRLGTLGEDLDLVVRLRRRGYELGEPRRVGFIPDPVAWTAAPGSLRTLGLQRDRWSRGLSEVLWRHRRLAFNARYGSAGLVGYPYFVVVELLGPLVEVIGLAALGAGLLLGAVDLRFALLYFLVAYGVSLVLTGVTLMLEEFSFHRYEGREDRILLLVWALLENGGYRQLGAFWRLRGLVKFLRGDSDWGATQRGGFQADRS